MEKKLLNHWQWQDNFGFLQAVEITDGQQVFYCAGQTAVGAEGDPLHKNDMSQQINLSLDNLEEVLQKGGYNCLNVMISKLFAFCGQLQLSRRQIAVAHFRMAKP